MPPFRLIFMGTPEFAVPALRALATRPDLANLVGVYTQPDRPVGRGQKVQKTPIKEVAEELGIPVFQPVSINTPEEKRKLADLMADVAIVVAYAQILNAGVLNTPRLGCINIHASLLPKHRGASPIQASILGGDKETGITTMRLVPQMDAGPILLQKSIPITDETTTADLQKSLADLGASLIVETLEKIKERVLVEKEQNDAEATYAKKIKKEYGKIDWKKSGIQILRELRAYYPWPGSYVDTSRGILKVHKAKFHSVHASGLPTDAQPGDIFLGAGSFWIRVSDGWVEPLIVQPEGKKPMDVSQYLNGLKGQKGQIEVKFL